MINCWTIPHKSNSSQARQLLTLRLNVWCDVLMLRSICPDANYLVQRRSNTSNPNLCPFKNLINWLKSKIGQNVFSLIFNSEFLYQGLIKFDLPLSILIQPDLHLTSFRSNQSANPQITTKISTNSLLLPPMAHRANFNRSEIFTKIIEMHPK